MGTKFTKLNSCFSQRNNERRLEKQDYFYTEKVCKLHFVSK